MRPTDQEPDEQEIEELVIGEERRIIDNPEVPEEVKIELLERIERFQDLDLEHEQVEDARHEP